MFGFLRQRDVVVAVTTGLFVTGAWAAGTEVFHYGRAKADAILTPCSEETITRIRAGEQAFSHRKWDAAEGYANDAITISPTCALSFELLGATKLQEMIALPKKADPTLRQQIRSDCFKAASRAKDLGDTSPRNENSVEDCAASNVYGDTDGTSESGRRRGRQGVSRRLPAAASAESDET